MPREIKPQNNLYRARYAAGLTQGQLAEQVGVSRQMVNQYERGKAVPSPEVAGRIIDVLGPHLLRLSLTEDAA
jgi:transcriptional regulator with XRE-family HTH domain